MQQHSQVLQQVMHFHLFAETNWAWIASDKVLQECYLFDQMAKLMTMTSDFRAPSSAKEGRISCVNSSPVFALHSANWPCELLTAQNCLC